MNGARVLRTDIDKDSGGTIDHWDTTVQIKEGARGKTSNADDRLNCSGNPGTLEYQASARPARPVGST